MEVGLTLKEAEESFEKEFITLNLNHTGGNSSKAVKSMGIQRTYLSRLISKYRLAQYTALSRGKIKANNRATG